MCFAPQRRALIRHLNFQKWSENGVFCAFDFEMCFAPQRPALSGPVLRCFVHFDLEMCFAPQRRAIFISHLASWLCTRHFREPTFRSSGATNHWEKSVLRLFYLFGDLDLLSSETFSSLISSLLLFSSLFFCSTSAFHLSYCRKFDF